MVKDVTVNLMILIWWTAGLVWLAHNASGRQLAEIRPAWARYAAVVLTFPAFFTFWLFVRMVECWVHILSDVPATWRTFVNSVKGIPTEGERG